MLAAANPVNLASSPFFITRGLVWLVQENPVIGILVITGLVCLVVVTLARKALKTEVREKFEGAAREEFTRIRCSHCGHTQVVSDSDGAFSCEQCKAYLKNHAAPDDGQSRWN